MSETVAATASPGRGPSVLRWLCATAVAWLFVDAAFSMPARAGVSTFGDPPELSVLWLACAAGWAAAVSRAPDRLAIARRLLLALLVATLLGRRLVPADAGLRLALLGLLLWAAAPWLRPRSGARATLLVLGLALPALLWSVFPQGAVLWLEYALPAAALALLLPALAPGRAARTAGAVLVLATGAACAAALATYVVLARGLTLPLANVALTRLHLLGIHPNLAVPHLVTTLVVGVALLPGAGRKTRLLLLAALAASSLALLAVQSRTGLLVAGFGLGMLALLSRAGRLTTALHRLAVLGVAALLLFPLSGLSTSSITHPTGSLVSKAVSFRSAMWELGTDTLAAAPWHGFGPGRFYVQGRYARSSRYDGLPKDDHPHNVLLATGEALGWPGLAGLLLLFAAGVRRPRAGGALANAATAAALAVWAADAVDLGGADATLYPALAFLLLGLRHAAALPDDPGRGAPPGARARRIASLAGAAIAVAGLLLLAGEWAKQRALRATDAALESPTLEPLASEALALGVRLSPLDPELRMQQARLAQAGHHPDEATAALREALRLYPENAALVHQLALSLATFDPEDPRVDQLLQQAIALDPHGEGAGRRLKDRARVRALLNDASGATDALVAAVLLDPGAVADLPTRSEGEELALLPGGPGGADVPLKELLDRLAARRAELASVDPPSEVRLRMREVEVLRALQLWDRADAAARHLLAGDKLYLSRQLAQSALARNSPEQALAAIREVGPQDNFWSATDLVEALSKLAEPRPEEYDQALHQALAIQARDADLVFELPTVKRLLEAQRVWAERRGDALAASRFADALDFAAR